MSAYNRTNGEPCSASKTLLQKILREEWGFDGYVVSDCGAILDMHQHHMVTSSPEKSSALAVNSGCDLNCGKTYSSLVEAVRQGLINEETIDRSVARLMRARFLLGMFDSMDFPPGMSRFWTALDDVEPGTFRVYIGGRQPDSRSKTSAGSAVLREDFEVSEDRLEVEYQDSPSWIFKGSNDYW